MLKIEKTQQGNHVVLTLEGRLDTITAPELEEFAEKEIKDADELTLDLEKLEYLSSSGLRVLLSLQKQMAKRTGMTVHNVNEMIMEIFDITGFTEILTIV